MLKDVALQDASDDARTAAVSSLARVRTEQVVDALIDLYDRGSGDAVKEEVIRGLGRSESRKASEKLLAIARGDANPKLRQQAVRRLSQTRGDGVWVN